MIRSILICRPGFTDLRWGVLIKFNSTPGISSGAKEAAEKGLFSS
jgi:hypothetical protein